jgi:hypothetical protein
MIKSFTEHPITYEYTESCHERDVKGATTNVLITV